MSLKQVFASGGLQRFKYVTDFQDFAGPKVDAEATSQPGNESAGETKVDSKKAKDTKSTPADKKKTPKEEPKDDSNQDFPV